MEKLEWKTEGEITLDVTKLNLVWSDTMIRQFMLEKLVVAYRVFIDIQGNMPTEILMSEDQQDAYRVILEDFARCLGIDYRNKDSLTFWGVPIHTKKL